MNTLTVVFLVLALGYLLGRASIKGLSLGTSGIILVALVFGHFGYSIPKEIQNLGLALFVCAVGYIAGPVFFHTFKQKAFAFITLGIVIILVGGAVSLAAIYLFDIPTPLSVGLMCGALTSTPGLAAAIEASGDAMASVGYGIGYPFGVVGVVLFVQLLPKLFKYDIQAEIEALTAVDVSRTQKTEKKKLQIDPFGLCCFSIASMLGILLGNIKIPLPGGATFSFGVSGGPLITGLLFGYLRNIGRLSLEVPDKTLKVLREFGLALFLLGAGLSAGNGFVAVLKEYGVGLFLIGVVMTTLPMIVGFVLSRKVFKIAPFTSLGSICGGMTSTPALGALIAVAGTDSVAASYAATYPVALISVVLLSQFLCIFG
ncbi:MAG: permease [Clostridiaceae bacterium]|jgi:putative transport protein|nr:permease [Clostridiaceae bacterium]